ncbi:Zn-binding Pro-Ala-Ala-Arg (PAAR) domain-containing protein, incolved in TypeVI secretion [Massilia sp. PDC64]|nr:PAAR domain-containing protein [Massilia sp. PDC64]SDE35966.1 Zn-binding Pro-Ala-Ala-Arg (PAAR) domain-containing protein, incolved in TypeVI secretion [Massilia sp. PDC64]
MAGEIIRKGDPTSHGGTVLEGSLTDICHGKPIAYIGHKVHCPKCGGDFPIVEGVVTTTFYGKGVAIAGMKTSCGASLVPTQFTDTVEYGGGSQARNLGGQVHESHAVPLAQGPAPSGVDQAEKGGAAPDKAVTRLFWTYGTSELPLADVSRHYVDLNLHVDTVNYSPGETVEITLQHDDGSELLAGVPSLQVQAVVGPDGTAKIRDVFKGKTVQIGVIG